MLNAQTLIRDIYAEAPDSIFPLLTRNNRLDQIDFHQAGMKAEVKNRFDDHSELLFLGDKYLKLRCSERCLVEMRLLDDSTLCMVETFFAPAADSRIRLFRPLWHEVRPCPIGVPSVDDFLPEDTDEDVRLALRALPLIKATLSPDDDAITFELQTSELNRQQKKEYEGRLHSITRRLQVPAIPLSTAGAY